MTHRLVLGNTSIDGRLDNWSSDWRIGHLGGTTCITAKFEVTDSQAVVSRGCQYNEVVESLDSLDTQNDTQNQVRIQRLHADSELLDVKTAYFVLTSSFV